MAVTLPSHYHHIAVTLPSHYRHIVVTGAAAAALWRGVRAAAAAAAAARGGGARRAHDALRAVRAQGGVTVMLTVMLTVM